MAARTGQRQPAGGGTGPGGRDPSDADLDARIDQLYQLPLHAFTAARNALAKSLAADGWRNEAARVKGLAKPTVLPWAVNQVYWQARSVWERLLAAGDALRDAQVAALEQPGRTPAAAQQVRDRLRVATDAHRQALADAVHQAIRASTQAQVHPQTDLLSRMLEALSLAPVPPAPPGRLTDIIQPAGFEALLGVTPGPPPPSAPLLSRRPASQATGAPTVIDRRPARGTRGIKTGQAAPARGGDERDARAAGEAERLRQARIDAATMALERATAAEHAAREAEARAAEAVADLELRLTQARAALGTAQSTVRGARAAREKADVAVREAHDT
ncbi:MAG: hypothetical protein AB7N65_08095 [Vicinamibacterales bacterium]